MKRFPRHKLSKFWRRNQALSKLVMLVILPFAPIIYAAAAVYEDRAYIKQELGGLVSAIFLPWTKE